MDKDLAKGNYSSWASQDNLKDVLLLLRTGSAKVVRRWQNSKQNILQIDFPGSVRKGNVYTLYLTPLTPQKWGKEKTAEAAQASPGQANRGCVPTLPY